MVGARALIRTTILPAGAALALAACATSPAPRPYTGMDVGRLADGRPRAYNRPYQVRGRWYTPADQPGYDRTGLASWYSYESSSGRTADGERFDARLATAAHTTLPIPSWLEVTNLDNGRSARLRLNDRGPFAAGRILDVSKAAAVELGFYGQGVTRVRVRYLGPAGTVGAPPVRLARAAPPPTVTTQSAAEPPPPRPSLQDEVREDLAQTPDETPDSAAAVVPGPSGSFAVQAGAFADLGNAERVARRLESAGPALVRPLALADGGVVYRVLVGPWPGTAQAADARSRVVALGFADAQVVSP